MALDYVPAKVPLVGEVISVILQMSTFGVLCFCLSTVASISAELDLLKGVQREERNISRNGPDYHWPNGVSPPLFPLLKRRGLTIQVILMIYADSALFVFATSIVVNGFGINSSRGVFEGRILLCEFGHVGRVQSEAADSGRSHMLYDD